MNYRAVFALPLWSGLSFLLNGEWDVEPSTAHPSQLGRNHFSSAALWKRWGNCVLAYADWPGFCFRRLRVRGCHTEQIDCAGSVPAFPSNHLKSEKKTHFDIFTAVRQRECRRRLPSCGRRLPARTQACTRRVFGSARIIQLIGFWKNVKPFNVAAMLSCIYKCKVLWKCTSVLRTVKVQKRWQMSSIHKEALYELYKQRKKQYGLYFRPYSLGFFWPLTRGEQWGHLPLGDVTVLRLTCPSRSLILQKQRCLRIAEVCGHSRWCENGVGLHF